MNIDDFQNHNAGKLVRVGSGETAYWAFIPNPLPPKIEPDMEILRVTSEAALALGELAGIGRNIPNPELLIQPFMNREAVLSSRIEGTQAEISDLYAFQAQISEQRIGATSSAVTSDVREVSNYVMALKYGLKRLSELPICGRLICELHERLMAGVRCDQTTPGEFRRSQNWVGPKGCTLNQAIYVPPPPPEMTEAFGLYEKYLNVEDPLPPLIRLALIHYQFEAIHPFIDGNGRIGRLLISLLLVQWGLLPSPLLYLSDYFERHRQQYYDLLLAVSQRGAWQEWVLFFLHGIGEQSRDASARAKKLRDLQDSWNRQLLKTKVSKIVADVCNQLFVDPYIYASLVQKLFGVTHPTAMSALRKLKEIGIVQEKKLGSRGIFFIAQPILNIVR